MSTMTPPWTSLTGRLYDHEIASIQSFWENSSFPELIDTMLVCDPIVALRILAEIMLHLPASTDLDPNFKALLENEKLSQHWAKFVIDRDVDKNDVFYATEILTLMQNISLDLAKKQALEITVHKPSLLK